MLSDPKHEQHLDRLEDMLRRAQAVTPQLISNVVEHACVRLAAHGAVTTARFNRLIEVGAWTEAALALAELELPQWKMRRLVYEDGEWLCSLSKQPQLPLGFDQLAETRHEILPLAILLAVLHARRAASADTHGVSTVPHVRPLPSRAVCCDNFS